LYQYAGSQSVHAAKSTILYRQTLRAGIRESLRAVALRV
jgi:hypothetical protein